MKKILLCAVLLAATNSLFAQKFLTRTGKVSFYSATPMEKIEAINNDVAAVVDGASAAMKFIVPVKSFKFERQLMQEHFNENYMESDKFPKSEFSGKLSDPSAVNWTKDGKYAVTAVGKMTMHGVTKDVSIPGTVSIVKGVPTLQAKFAIVPQDYKINIPSVVSNKIAEKIDVTVNVQLTKQ
jgi:polyisoprenoid-binding protein YceI